MSGEMKFGGYDLSELNETDRVFWLTRAQNNDLPPIPEEKCFVSFFRKFETGIADFPEMKARAVITADGKIRKWEDFIPDKHVV